MKSITIKGTIRDSLGKSSTKSLRNSNRIPCVLYGGEKNIHFSGEEKYFKKLVYTPNAYTAMIDIDENKIPCILQDIQFHPVTDKILHIDFYQLFDDKEITMEIPVILVGSAPGVMAGGSLRFPKRKLRVRALPIDLPDSIDVDISKLEIGDKILVNEISIKNCKILHLDSIVVVQVKMSRVVKEPVVEEVSEEKKDEESPEKETEK